ncbi:MAG TPA: hypothetical protein VGD68_04305 [Streptosporangiaceae bacterium]
MTHVGMPAGQLAQMRQSPWFPALEAIAPTLAYDHAGLIGSSTAVPVDKAAKIAVPALVMYGSVSPALMGAAARTLSETIPELNCAKSKGRTTTCPRRCWRPSSNRSWRA